MSTDRSERQATTGERDTTTPLGDPYLNGFVTLGKSHAMLLAVFALLGVVRVTVYVTRRWFEIPEYVTTVSTQGWLHPEVALLPSGPVVAYPLFGTFRGLVPRLLAVYAVTALVWVGALTVAIGVIAWRTDPETAGWLPPRRRLLHLAVFVGTVQIVGIPLLLERVPLSGLLPTVVALLIVAVLVSRLLVVPVTIIRDGRDLPSALGWSWRASRGETPLVVLFVLAFALIRHWITALPASDLLTYTVPVHALVGTTLIGGAYAGLMCVAYDIAATQSDN
ncbi:hypothetical protein [Halapricum desulfuricans]|uniref:Uncharacterized protein n=1 Tax=Halapricum desulfuricans TaxID=2841257 RepID=A0A897MYJ8_9EURY|nr:hypothetical protein [Halapricum desulfuricans]QSG05534.1 hypothetical protein HSR121_1187 [Halapricum desulfuricans]